MPKFGSKIDVAGKVFDLKRQNVATKNDMLALVVPRGYKTFCDELNAWYEYMGDDYEVNELTGRWRKDSNDDTGVHVVDDLPPITIDNNTNWLLHKFNEVTPISEEYIVTSITDEMHRLSDNPEIPEQGDNDTERWFGLYVENNIAYDIIVLERRDENSNLIDIFVLVVDGNGGYEVVNNPNNATTPLFVVRPNINLEVAKNGHIYLAKKTITTTFKEFFQFHSPVEYTATIRVVDDLSSYDVYVPSGNLPSGSMQYEELVPNADTVFDFIIYYDEANETNVVYHKYENTLYPTEIEAVYNANEASPNTSYVIIKSNEKDLFDEYIFVYGRYELLGTDYSIDFNNIKSSLSDILSTVNSRINQVLAKIYDQPTALWKAIRCSFDDPEGFDYFDVDDYVVLSGGYTKDIEDKDIYSLDTSDFENIELYNETDIERSLVIFEDISTTESLTIPVYCRTEWKYPWYRNGELQYYPVNATTYGETYTIKNIDKVNETFDIYYDDTLMEEAVPFSKISYDDNYTLVKYVRGISTYDIVEHLQSEIIKNAFGDSPTQNDINEQLALGAFVMDKVFEDYGWIEDILDSRDTDSISKKIVPISLNISDFNKCDGFVIEDVVLGLKNNATEVTFTRPEFSYIFNDTPTATTWCYIGSAELFTGTSDGIDYTFAWNKSNPAEAIIWRSTEIPNTGHDDDVTSENHVKLRGYKICDNLAGQLIKSLLNAQNS